MWMRISSRSILVRWTKRMYSTRMKIKTKGCRYHLLPCLDQTLLRKTPNLGLNLNSNNMHNNNNNNNNNPQLQLYLQMPSDKSAISESLPHVSPILFLAHSRFPSSLH